MNSLLNFNKRIFSVFLFIIFGAESFYVFLYALGFISLNLFVDLEFSKDLMLVDYPKGFLSIDWPKRSFYLTGSTFRLLLLLLLAEALIYPASIFVFTKSFS